MDCPPLSGHVSSDGCARRGSHKALTASPSSVPRSSSAAATRRMPRRPQPVLANQAAERRSASAAASCEEG